MNEAITAESLRQTVSYDAETGDFSWRIDRSRARAGEALGSWDLHGYKTVRIWGRSYKLHRLAWLYVYGEWPQGDVDHINGIRHDNRLTNLRDIPRRMNLENRRTANPGKKSGLPLGVHRDKKAFLARISCEGRRINIGNFPTAEEASAAYIQAKREMHRGCML